MFIPQLWNGSKARFLITSVIAILFAASSAVAQNSTDSVERSLAVAPSPVIQQIQKVVSQSSCAQHSWKNRGRAPAGYTKGVALSFAKSLCRMRIPTPQAGPALLMSSADSHNDRKDALSHYHSILSQLRMTSNISGEDTLRSLYTLGMGLGMRESSGTYCEGWDTSAGSQRPSSAAEAGPFQVSYDSMGASPELKKLYSEYQASPHSCLLSTFQEGVSCKNQKILGSGAGATFQVFNKSCPAFATEYAMTLLRVLRGHFGPINRMEAEILPECNSMLAQVQKTIDDNPAVACPALF